MKAKYIALLACSAMLGFTACDEDDIDGESIFASSNKIENDFDKWLKKNYVDTYNIEVQYRYTDKETDNTYNLVPAAYDKSIALAKLTKYLWLDVYKELAGEEFIKTYCPKVITFVGSPAYNTQGSIVLGTAEGGVKITLYNVNELNYKKVDVDFLNYWYFKTMHHEFAHILHQTKSYTTDFNLITPEDYQSTSWVNVEFYDALQMGFITPYASNEFQEDFVETLSNYVTHTQDWWDGQMQIAGMVWISKTEYNAKSKADKEKYQALIYDDNIYYYEIGGVSNGPALIQQKLDIVRDYLKTSWGIDLDELRAKVLEKESQVDTLDLVSLN